MGDKKERDLQTAEASLRKGCADVATPLTGKGARHEGQSNLKGRERDLCQRYRNMPEQYPASQWQPAAPASPASPTITRFPSVAYGTLLGRWRCGWSRTLHHVPMPREPVMRPQEMRLV